MRANDGASRCVSEQRVTDEQDFERGCRADSEGNNRGRGRATSTREMRRECDDTRGHAKRICITSTVVQVRRTKKTNSAKRDVQSTSKVILRRCVCGGCDGEAAKRRGGELARPRRAHDSTVTGAGDRDGEGEGEGDHDSDHDGEEALSQTQAIQRRGQATARAGNCARRRLRERETAQAQATSSAYTHSRAAQQHHMLLKASARWWKIGHHAQATRAT